MTTKTDTTQNFSADVSRLLDIVANALYTNHDVFLRELISNAADACDRLRYDAIAKPELVVGDPDYRIHIYRNAEKRELTIVDNGIGMSAKELADHLGTIAKSGTAKIMEKASKAAAKDEESDPLKLIGQFGVGFYASYMVADHVRVLSKKAGAKSANIWESDGATGFTVRKASDDETQVLDGDRGTAITLHIKDEGSEFLIPDKVDMTVKQYSDHIDVPIYLVRPDDRNDADAPVNKASAIWQRSKSEVSAEEYTEFYKHITHGFDEPLMTSHWRAEGKIEFSALTFIPTMRPWDLYDPGRKDSVKLYVRRVFISDNIEGMMYPWMRFVRGVIDSEDLPLNISRETLQYNPIITKIRSAVTKRVLSDLDKMSRDDTPGFLTFWGQFGATVKEGLYDAPEHREGIFKICRFASTHDAEKFTSLEDYIDRMKDGQEEIYYISGENLESLRSSPQIEGFKARGLEVLFFTDTIDDFWIQQSGDYKGKTLRSVTKGNVDLSKFESETKSEGKKETKDEAPKFDALIASMKETLSEEVEDVVLSNRLTDSPVCLIAPDTGVDIHMERVLKVQQKYVPTNKPVLEINPDHALIQKLTTLSDIEDAAHLLMDQAKIIQGMPVQDTGRFTRLMSTLMEKGF